MRIEFRNQKEMPPARRRKNNRMQPRWETQDERWVFTRKSQSSRQLLQCISISAGFLMLSVRTKGSFCFRSEPDMIR